MSTHCHIISVIEAQSVSVESDEPVSFGPEPPKHVTGERKKAVDSITLEAETVQQLARGRYCQFMQIKQSSSMHAGIPVPLHLLKLL